MYESEGGVSILKHQTDELLCSVHFNLCEMLKANFLEVLITHVLLSPFSLLSNEQQLLAANERLKTSLELLNDELSKKSA